MGFTSLASSLSLIKAGKLRPVAVTSKERVPALPDVPPLADTPGLEAYELNNWFGLFAPAGVPAPVLQTLHAATLKALGPELQQVLVDLGGIPAPDTPEQFRSFIAAEWVAFAAIVKDIGVTIDG
jgi:tripartite-type tricarboxylate transporter receptor subunit TctC